MKIKNIWNHHLVTFLNTVSGFSTSQSGKHGIVSWPVASVLLPNVEVARRFKVKIHNRAMFPQTGTNSWTKVRHMVDQRMHFLYNLSTVPYFHASNFQDVMLLENQIFTWKIVFKFPRLAGTKEFFILSPLFFPPATPGFAILETGDRRLGTAPPSEAWEEIPCGPWKGGKCFFLSVHFNRIEKAKVYIYYIFIFIE